MIKYEEPTELSNSCAEEVLMKHILNYGLDIFPLRIRPDWTHKAQSVASPAAQRYSLLVNSFPGAIGLLLSLCDIFKHIIMWAALARFELALPFFSSRFAFKEQTEVTETSLQMMLLSYFWLLQCVQQMNHWLHSRLDTLTFWHWTVSFKDSDISRFISTVKQTIECKVRIQSMRQNEQKSQNNLMPPGGWMQQFRSPTPSMLADGSNFIRFNVSDQFKSNLFWVFFLLNCFLKGDDTSWLTAEPCSWLVGQMYVRELVTPDLQSHLYLHWLYKWHTWDICP